VRRRQFLKTSGAALAGLVRDPFPTVGKVSPTNSWTAQRALSELAQSPAVWTSRYELFYRNLVVTLYAVGGHLGGYWSPSQEITLPWVLVSWTPFSWRRVLITDINQPPGIEGLPRYLASWGCLPCPSDPRGNIPDVFVTPLRGPCPDDHVSLL
jgi:hypothetical protein